MIADWDEKDYIWSVYADNMEFDLFMTRFGYGFYF